jgi:integrase
MSTSATSPTKIRSVRGNDPPPASLLPRARHDGRSRHPERGKKWYDAFRARTLADGKTPISVAYHRAALINARSHVQVLHFDEMKWIHDEPARRQVEGRWQAQERQAQADRERAAPVVRVRDGSASRGNDAALALMIELAMALRSGDICRRLVRDVDLDGTQLIIEDGKTEASNEPRIIPTKLQPLVRALVAGRGSPLEPLFKTTRTETGTMTIIGSGKRMERFCRLAKVPHFPPHALKGISGTVIAKRGAAGNLVMDHLSHEDERTTRRHYVDGGVIEAAQARAGVQGDQREGNDDRRYKDARDQTLHYRDARSRAGRRREHFADHPS